jgi:alpha-L-rhamnosidase
VIQFEPRFTYHGFRYASISELWWLSPGELCEEILAGKAVEASVLATDLNEIGHVTMDSNEWIAIERACIWSSRSNLMGIPTDCPQRDVRFMYQICFFFLTILQFVLHCGVRVPLL